MLIQAMQKANSSDPKKYLPVLAKLDFTGATGKIGFDDKGDRKDAEIVRRGKRILRELGVRGEVRWVAHHSGPVLGANVERIEISFAAAEKLVERLKSC